MIKVYQREFYLCFVLDILYETFTIFIILFLFFCRGKEEREKKEQEESEIFRKCDGEGI